MSADGFHIAPGRRATTADRETTLAVLREAYATGAISDRELSARTDYVTADTRTMSELERVISDLVPAPIVRIPVHESRQPRIQVSHIVPNVLHGLLCLALLIGTFAPLAFAMYYNWPTSPLNVLFVMGVLFGGVIATVFSVVRLVAHITGN